MKKEIKKNEYKCAMCNHIYKKGWTDEKAKAEATELFGKSPDKWNDKQVVVCDKCFQKIHPKKHPQQLENAKNFI